MTRSLLFVNMRICKKPLIELVQLLLGLNFLISGFTKALNTDTFINLILSYGVSYPNIVAPIIIFIELLLGFSLVFGIHLKYSSLASFCIVISFTIIYTYGYLGLDVKDCGCYGNISFLNRSPSLLYFRNLLILGGSALVYIKSASKSIPIPASIFYLLSTLMFTGAFICGHTSLHIKKEKEHNYFNPIELSQHPLNDFIKTSPDSIYLVTVFSYSCPHCINSIGNIEQFMQLKVVDKLIGIALENDDAELEFREIFNLKFPVQNYSRDKISKLSVDLPIFYFIKNDSIVRIVKGEIPSAYFFKPNKTAHIGL